MLDRINPSVDKLITHVEERSNFTRPAGVAYQIQEKDHSDDSHSSGDSYDKGKGDEDKGAGDNG